MQRRRLVHRDAMKKLFFCFYVRTTFAKIERRVAKIKHSTCNYKDRNVLRLGKCMQHQENNTKDKMCTKMHFRNGEKFVLVAANIYVFEVALNFNILA